mmetsp:Transcript_14036/g.38234  ORF Transcript_14036/g.38234 Transcript_14036/m.38234 type:complete len:85 (-) Transcript_14036:637-891(-)
MIRPSSLVTSLVSKHGEFQALRSVPEGEQKFQVCSKKIRRLTTMQGVTKVCHCKERSYTRDLGNVIVPALGPSFITKFERYVWS